MTAHRANRAFTLIEVIAVVIILAILAGVALPKYLETAAQAQESATRATLGSVRAGIATFYANTAITGDATYPTFDQLRTVDEVLDESIPRNPYNNSSAVRNAEGTWDVENPPVSGSEGWAYDATAGKFWANSNGNGENTW